MGLVAVDSVLLAALVTDSDALEAELVKEAIAELTEVRSEPVAVEASDSSDCSWVLTSVAMDDCAEVTSELMEATTEDECVDADDPAASSEAVVSVEVEVEVVTVVDCAAASEARARTAAVKRMVAVCWWLSLERL